MYVVAKSLIVVIPACNSNMRLSHTAASYQSHFIAQRLTTFRAKIILTNMVSAMPS